jgi:predicted DsbA family dithiol-disulfide isomerase
MLKIGTKIMSDVVCPWCGSAPSAFPKWEEDGHISKRFGCNNQACPVRPYLDMSMMMEDTARTLWNNQSVVSALKKQIAETGTERDSKECFSIHIRAP